jgi:hypothetical protein
LPEVLAREFWMKVPVEETAVDRTALTIRAGSIAPGA